MDKRALLESIEREFTEGSKGKATSLVDIEQQVKELGEDMSDSIADFLYDLGEKIRDGELELNAKAMGKIEAKLLKVVRDLEVSAKHYLEALKEE